MRYGSGGLVRRSSPTHRGAPSSLLRMRSRTRCEDSRLPRIRRMTWQISSRLARFRYSDQQLIVDRARLSWRTRRVIGFLSPGGRVDCLRRKIWHQAEGQAQDQIQDITLERRPRPAKKAAG